MACHGGTVDQTAGHGANWGGSNMASAMRDPIFRANEVLVNNTIKNLGAGDGAGNVCMRCHSPNGWLSGRFDPILGGAADGSDTIQSILLSTDTEGISCEMCHRVMGNVTHSKMTTGIDPVTGLAITTDLVGDPAFNMLSGISDWPHLGDPYPRGQARANPSVTPRCSSMTAWGTAGNIPAPSYHISATNHLLASTTRGRPGRYSPASEILACHGLTLMVLTHFSSTNSSAPLRTTRCMPSRL